MHVETIFEQKREILKIFNEYLSKAHLTQVQLARMVAPPVPVQAVQRVVKGESRNESILRVIRDQLPAFYRLYLDPKTR
jgi:hypothetical protein